MRSTLFPVFLKLAGRKVVLVGGGSVAASKLGSLTEADAEVTVVAPVVCSQIEQAEVTILRREFVPADLDSAWLVVAAAPPRVNQQVAQAAEERRVFVNAVDDAQNATTYLGGVFRRAGVTVAISTDGDAPALAGLLREGLETLIPDDLHSWMTEARAIRSRWLAAGVPIARRRPLLLQALNRLYEDTGVERQEQVTEPQGVASR